MVNGYSQMGTSAFGLIYTLYNLRNLSILMKYYSYRTGSKSKKKGLDSYI